MSLHAPAVNARSDQPTGEGKECMPQDFLTAMFITNEQCEPVLLVIGHQADVHPVHVAGAAAEHKGCQVGPAGLVHLGEVVPGGSHL